MREQEGILRFADAQPAASDAPKFLGQEGDIAAASLAATYVDLKGRPCPANTAVARTLKLDGVVRHEILHRIKGGAPLDPAGPDFEADMIGARTNYGEAPYYGFREVGEAAHAAFLSYLGDRSPLSRSAFYEELSGGEG